MSSNAESIIDIEKEYIMGKSNSVQKQIEADKRNQEFINQIDANLRQTLTGAENDLETRINDFYRGNDRNWKNSQYVFGSQQSYEIEETWSLDNLNKLITSITNAVIGTVTGQIILPEGTEASSEVPDINQQAGITDELQLMVAANTVNLFSGMLNSFGAINTAKTDRGTQSIPLGQGLRIFATVGVNIQRSESFFNNNFTIGYYYVYSIQYSLDEFQRQGEQSVLTQYHRSLEELDIASGRNFQQFLGGTITIQQYLITANVLADETRKIIKQIEELNGNNRQDTIQLRQHQLAWLNRLQIDYGYNQDVDAFLSPLIAEAKQKINASER